MADKLRGRLNKDTKHFFFSILIGTKSEIAISLHNINF